jgi:hypothetical protein
VNEQRQTKFTVKKRWVMLVLAGLLAAAVVVLVWPGEREPEYQGKKLSAWLRYYRANGQEHDEAASAVRQIGGRAVPWLLMWMDSRGIPPWKVRLINWTMKIPGIQQTKAFRRMIDYIREQDGLLITALYGFELLGPEARRAIPALAKRLNNPLEDRRNGAVIALSFIGKEALPLLLSALSDESRSNRVLIAHCIRDMRNLGDEANKAAPVLIRCMQGTDKPLAAVAAEALGKLHVAPVSAVYLGARSWKKPSNYTAETRQTQREIYGRAPASLECRRFVASMPLLRSLAESIGTRYYKHGAPNGAQNPSPSAGL